MENIICRFCIPKKILSDNGMPFQLLMEEYQIYHGKSTRYYTKGNGLIEAFTKTLAAVIGKIFKEAPISWDDCLLLALWAYRTTKSTTTKQTPFSQVYGAVVVRPTDQIKVPSSRMLLSTDQG